MKKVIEQTSGVTTFGKRLTLVEEKIESNKQRNEQAHEGLKEYVAKVKEALENRVGAVIDFNDKIEKIKKELKDTVRQNDDFQRKIVELNTNQNREIINLQNKMQQHTQQLDAKYNGINV